MRFFVGASGHRIYLPLPGDLRPVQGLGCWYCSGCGAVVSRGTWMSHLFDPPHTRWVFRPMPDRRGAP